MKVYVLGCYPCYGNAEIRGVTTNPDLAERWKKTGTYMPYLYPFVEEMEITDKLPKTTV